MASVLFKVFKSKESLSKAVLRTIVIQLLPQYLSRLGDIQQGSDKSAEYKTLDVAIGRVVAETYLPDAECNMAFRSILENTMSPFSMLLAADRVYQDFAFFNMGEGARDILIRYYETILGDISQLAVYFSSSLAKSEAVEKNLKKRRGSEAASSSSGGALEKNPSLDDTEMLTKFNLCCNELSIVLGVRMILIDIFTRGPATSVGTLEAACSSLARAHQALSQIKYEVFTKFVETASTEVQILFDLLSTQQALLSLRFVDTALFASLAENAICDSESQLVTLLTLQFSYRFLRLVH